MNAVIIGAERKEYTLLNAHRSNMLRNALEAQGYVVNNTIGYDGEIEEAAFLIDLGTRKMESLEHDYFVILAEVFEQDYFIEIKNDVAYKIVVFEDVSIRMGLWWQRLDNAPPSVLDSHCYTHDTDNDVHYVIQTPEMAKADAFKAAELACELAGGDKCCTPHVRSFIYGTPEWFERQASTRRTYRY